MPRKPPRTTCPHGRLLRPPAVTTARSAKPLRSGGGSSDRRSIPAGHPLLRRLAVLALVPVQTCTHADLDGQHVLEWRNWLLVDQDLKLVGDPEHLGVVVGHPDDYRFPALTGQCFADQIAFPRTSGARYAMFTDDGAPQAVVWRLAGG